MFQAPLYDSAEYLVVYEKYLEFCREYSERIRYIPYYHDNYRVHYDALCDGTKSGRLLDQDKNEYVGGADNDGYDDVSSSDADDHSRKTSGGRESEILVGGTQSVAEMGDHRSSPRSSSGDNLLACQSAEGTETCASKGEPCGTTVTKVVMTLPRGPNYERNKKARERRKLNKLAAKSNVNKAAVESSPNDELRETWNQRRILENKKRAAIDKAFLDNLETDPEYFARSYRKYQAVNDASQTKAFYETTKAEVHLNTVNMYHKAVEAGYAKTVVSSLLSGSKAADSVSPHDSISAAEGLAELHAMKKEKQILEKKLADADHKARTVQAELDALKKDLVKPRSLEEWAKIDARRASEYRKATNRRLY
jgi:biotin carboxyl carrier protein